MSPQDSPVVIASFRSESDVQVAHDALSENSIDVVVGRDPTLGSAWLSLAVNRADAERALSVLERLWPAETADAYEAAERCPRCGAPNPRALPRLMILLVAGALLIPAGLFFNQTSLFGLTFAVVALVLLIAPNRRCRSCGERWDAPFRVEKEEAVETPDVLCPRCGSAETSRIDHRREKAITLLVNMLLPPLVVVWPFVPKRRCSDCGHEWW